MAAIDLGTNSTHLLIASVDPKLRTFQVLLAEKSTTRLGERDPETGDLLQKRWSGPFGLRHCRELASSHEVEEIVCVATSAMREAPNGLAFLQEVERDFGLKARLSVGQKKLA